MSLSFFGGMDLFASFFSSLAPGAPGPAPSIAPGDLLVYHGERRGRPMLLSSLIPGGCDAVAVGLGAVYAVVCARTT